MSKQLGENMFRDNLDDYEARKDASRQTPALGGQWHSPSVVTTGNLDHLKMQEAPAPVDAGLDGNDIVSMMLSAWHSEVSHRKRMTAALRVAADALLGPVTDEEWSGASSYRKEQALYLAGMAGVNGLLETRRARLLAPAKSAEERVTVQYAPTPQKADPQPYRVYLDGEDAGEHFSSGDHAQIYRLGLIAKLKQEPKP